MFSEYARPLEYLPQKYYNILMIEATTNTDIAERLFIQKAQGNCCAQAMITMIGEDFGLPEADLTLAIRAAGGLCSGLGFGSDCGTLSGAVMSIFIVEFDKERAKAKRKELTDWFIDSFGLSQCDYLLDGNELNKLTVCPGLMEATYIKLREILDAK